MQKNHRSDEMSVFFIQHAKNRGLAFKVWGCPLEAVAPPPKCRDPKHFSRCQDPIAMFLRHHWNRSYQSYYKALRSFLCLFNFSCGWCDTAGWSAWTLGWSVWRAAANCGHSWNLESWCWHSKAVDFIAMLWWKHVDFIWFYGGNIWKHIHIIVESCNRSCHMKCGDETVTIRLCKRKSGCNTSTHRILLSTAWRCANLLPLEKKTCALDGLSWIYVARLGVPRHLRDDIWLHSLWTSSSDFTSSTWKFDNVTSSRTNPSLLQHVQCLIVSKLSTKKSLPLAASMDFASSVFGSVGMSRPIFTIVATTSSLE